MIVRRPRPPSIINNFILEAVLVSTQNSWAYSLLRLACSSLSPGNLDRLSPSKNENALVERFNNLIPKLIQLISRKLSTRERKGSYPKPICLVNDLIPPPLFPGNSFPDKQSSTTLAIVVELMVLGSILWGGILRYSRAVRAFFSFDSLGELSPISKAMN